MKKKKGSALIYVLAICLVLLIVGMSVFYMIFNGQRNYESTENLSSLRIEAETGLNIGAYYLVEKGYYKKLQVGETEVLNNINLGNGINPIENLESTYESVIDSQDLSNVENINGEMEYAKYNLKVSFRKLNSSKYLIISETSYKGQKYKETTAVTIKENPIKAFINSLASIAILNPNASINNLQLTIIHGVSEVDRIQNATINLNIQGDVNEALEKAIYENNENLYSNEVIVTNNKAVENTSSGLNLKFQKGDLNLSMEELNEYYTYLTPGTAILLPVGNNMINTININSITKSQFENYTGMFAMLPNSNKLVFINNGNINLIGKKGNSGMLNNCLVYSTGKISLYQNESFYKLLVKIENSWFGRLLKLKDVINRVLEILGIQLRTYNFNFYNTDLVANKGIVALESGVYVEGSFNYTENRKDLKGVLNTIVKK